MREKSVWIVMYGKRPIAAFKSNAKAQAALDVMTKIAPLAIYKLRPSVHKVPLQS